jgi:hypothetical protein
MSTDHHATLRTALGPLVAGRYYPVKFPQEKVPTWPAIRGTFVTFDNQIDQCGAGTEDDEDVRVQIDICATTKDAAYALRSLVLTTLAGLADPWIRQPGGGEAWDAEAKVHRYREDFVLYQSTP